VSHALQVDVFSFGVVLWEILKYKPTIAAIPFQGASSTASRLHAAWSGRCAPGCNRFEEPFSTDLRSPRPVWLPTRLTAVH